MRANLIYIILCGITVFFAISCTKPYAPKAITGAPSYLVVEGTINTGGDSTTILLSHTVSLNSGVSSVPELGAVITIQSNQNQSYSVPEIGNGKYASPALTLPTTAQYRLSIVTTDGKAYLSDYVTPVATPPIDSIGFTVESNKIVGTGIQIYVNTHDPNNNTHYYRWDYNQTWQFSPEYESYYISNGTKIILRTPAQQVYQCWSSNISTNIQLGSSAKLTQDVIYQAPLVFIPSTSEEIETRYSILVKQYALSADAYNYFSILKQNTEELGSIFDAQPSQLTGNVHCTTDATLPVIGYISAGTIQQMRVYIDRTQLPQDWRVTYPFDCAPDTALYQYQQFKNSPVIDQVAELLIPGTYPFSITVPIIPPGATAPTGWQYVDQDCGDCSIRGSTTAPSFWQKLN